MMIKVWLILCFLSCFVQYYMARKRLAHWIGGILPIIFGGFALYAWNELWPVGIPLSAVLAFFIPPVFLFELYEMVYWYSRWKAKLANSAG